MTQDMNCTKTVARQKEGSRKTLAILFEYGWSKPRVWLEHSLRLTLNDITARASRHYGSCPTRLRLVVTLLLMMVVGVAVWGQTDYSGIYYIANDNSGDRPAESVVYNAGTPISNYYLVPADNPKQDEGCHYADAWFNNQYSNTSGSGDYTGTNFGESEKPFLTTYKTNKDAATVPTGVTVRLNNSVWVLKKTSDGYYYIIHAATGKYVVYEPPYKDATNRKSMHLLTTDNPEDNAKFDVTIKSGNYNIRPVSVESGNRFFNVAGQNFDGYQANTESPGPYLHNGIVGLYSVQDKNSYWHLEDDAKNNYTIWPVITTTDGEIFTIEPFLTSVHSSYKIYYRLGGEDPALTEGGEPTDENTIEYTGTAVSFAGNTIVKAIVRANNRNSKVVTFNNTKCVLPTITNNYTSTNTFTITSTEGSTIYYTTDNTTPSNSSPSSIASGESFDLTDNMTVIKAIAVKDGYTNSEVATYTLSKCATPTIEFDENGQIKITSGKDTENNDITTTIRYKYGNNTPTRAEGTIYPGPFNLATNQTVIKAVAYADGYLISGVQTLTLTRYPAPIISYVDGIVTISSVDNDATIYYRTGTAKLTSNGQITDGSSSSIGEAVIEDVSTGTVIKAIALKSGYAFSTEVNYIATPYIEPCAKPTFSLSNNKLTITSATTGATIHYTKNGSDPTESSPSYSTPLDVSPGDVIRAIATKDGMAASEVAIYTVFKEISSWAGITDAEGSYVLSSNFSVSATYSGTFKGTIDGQYIVITGNSFPLFDKLDGATIKNVILDNVNIQSSANTNGHSGAIANEATGNTRIYNCGVLAKSGASSVSGSGSGSVGGIVGEISGNTRVVNCFSYASISGGGTRAGIVGKNNGTVGNTRVAMCMMYGDMPDGTSPVYAGNHTSNVQNFTEYNYWLYSTTNSEGKRVPKNFHYTTYNDQLAIDREEYLTRFPFYRHILNTHRELAAYFLFGTTANVSDISKDQIEEIGHWYVEKGTNAAKYPIIEKWEKNTKRITEVDITSMPTTTSDDKDYQGKLVTDMGDHGKLSVTVKIGSFSKTIDLPITDMDTEHYDYTFGKVVLPFANEFSGWTRDYSKICTGWKITNVGGTTTYSASNYNYADRDSKSKDIYSSSNPYVFAQGGNYIVPYGVSSITIEANFANAYYLSDASYDIGYNTSYATGNNQKALGGSTPTSYHNRKVYNSLTTLLADLKTTNYPNDQAIVLVGNFHYNGDLFASYTGKAVTIMSVDEDNNQEPDYGWYSYHTKNRTVCPGLRFDFLANIGIGMAAHVNGSTAYPGISMWRARGWFEYTETSLCIMGQSEIESGNFNQNDRWIANGGYFTQIIRSDEKSCNKLTYVQIGGNAYVKEFYPGTHTDRTGSFKTKFAPVNVTGGEIEECYMTGNNSKVLMEGDNIYFWCAGGKIGKFLGAYMDKPSATTVNLTAKIDHALITKFFGGGTSAAASINGAIDITINNSKVDFYCGGPEFSSVSAKPTVTTHAFKTEFGEYYGAGFGGTSITYERDGQVSPVDISGATTSFPSSIYKYPTNRLSTTTNGIGTCYKNEFIFYSTGTGGVARSYTGYAQFSLATTGNVTNDLKQCKVLGSFYGAGCQGMVDGTVTSTLADCTISHDAFGGGYEAESNELDVYSETLNNPSYYTKETCIFTDFGAPTTTPFKWVQGNKTNKNTQVAGKDEIYTDINLSELGNVTGEIKIDIKGGTVTGNVYGGGNKSLAESNTIVTIKNIVEADGITNPTMTSPTVNNVYGGGNLVEVKGDVTVNIQGGTVTNDVYGGGALAQTNTDTPTITSGVQTYPVTKVNLSGGTVGNVYGGGLGNADTEADVNGPVTVTVTGGTATNVFGCNNINGSPKSTVEVNIEKAASSTMSVTNVFGGGNLATYTGDPVVNIKNGTVGGNVYGGGAGVLVDGTERGVKGKVTGNPQVTIGDNDGNHTAKVTGDVYGGGDAADVAGTPVIIVNDCATEIGNLYGGGNAADVSGSSITIYGGIIGDAFGGGHGDKDASEPEKYADVNGNVTFNVYGGTIGRVFAGSNSKGSITGTSTLTINKTGSCDMKIGEVYGGGNEAAGKASTINIGCTGDIVAGDDGHAANPDKIGTDLEGIGYVYGGANQADIGATGEGNESNIEVNINSGIVANVFGGNNTSGTIYGTITVNVEKDNDASCVSNWYVGNVFGGGNLAAYTGSPAVNIKNGTVSGNVYGGGKGVLDSGDNRGVQGKVTGNPQVTIGDATNADYVAEVSGGVYGGGDAADVAGTPVILVAEKCNTIIGNVYGGGNAADVTGSTITINGGTIGDAFGGGHGDKNVTVEPLKYADVNGSVTFNVNGGKISRVFAGSNSKGSITGTSALTINKTSACDMIVGEVYGGGNEAAGKASTINIQCTGDLVTGDNGHAAHPENIGTTLEGIGYVYGGANKADIGATGEGNESNIVVNINSGIVANVFGGNNTSGNIYGTITVNIEKDASASCAENWYVGNVFGGGNLASYTGTPAVNILNGTISGNVYGGGNGDPDDETQTKGSTGGSVVTVGDLTSTHSAYQAEVLGDVYGGGNAAIVSGNSSVTLQKTNSSVRKLFGGGNAAGVSGSSTVTMTLGTVTDGVYGGCNSSGSVGAVTIALNGGQVGTDATHRADVFGGGYGHPTTTTDDVTVNIGTATTSGGNTTYSGTAVIYGDVYGGSALGQVNGSSSTTILNINSNSIHGTIYGGGMGSGTGDETKATTNGNIQIYYNTANTDLAGLYGGANANGNVVGNIEVNIKANIGASGAGRDLFGGGLGAATSTNGNVTVNIGDLTLDSSNDPVYNPVVYGNIYGGSSLGSVNDAVTDLTTVNILSGTIHGNTYGGGLGQAGEANVAKGQVNGTVIVNIGSGTVNSTTGFATTTDGFATFVAASDGSSGSVYGCNNTNGSPKGNVTVNVYQTAHTTTDEASYTGTGATYAIDQVFGGGNQADYNPTSGDSRATIHVYTCDNTIRRVFGGGNAAAAVGVVTQIDGGHFDYVYGGGNGEVTEANIGAGGTSLQIHGGKINNLFGGSNSQGTITGNMGVSVDNDCDCEGSGGTAQYVNEFFCGNNLASIGTAQNPVTINATIACGTKFGAVYGGCNLAPLFGSVNLTVEGGEMDYVYGGSKGRLADNSDPTNPIAAVAADISGDVTLTIKGGKIKNVFGGSNINGNIAGSIEVNIEKDNTSTCKDGWYVGNVYGASNLAAYTPTKTGNTLKVNIKNGTVSGNVYGGGKGASATVTSNPVVTIGDVTNTNYAAIVADDANDKDVNNAAFVGGNVYGGGDAAPVEGSTTVTYNDNNANTTVANIYGGGNNASVSGNATVTLKGKATVEHDVFGGGNKGIVQGKATVNIED